MLSNSRIILEKEYSKILPQRIIFQLIFGFGCIIGGSHVAIAALLLNEVDYVN